MDLSNDVSSLPETRSKRIEKMDTKQQNLQSLPNILKQGTKNMFAGEYQKAALLYENALNLISKDPYSEKSNLSEVDVCVIQYALNKCYIKDKKCFEKASDELIPLVVLHGQEFPMLYYGLAELCLRKHSYQQVESIIKNGLEAVANIQKNDMLSINWPGTCLEIPESDPDILMDMLKSLKAQCYSMQYSGNSTAGDTSDDTSCYISDESSESDDTEYISILEQELKPESVTAVFTSNETPQNDKEPENNSFDSSDSNEVFLSENQYNAEDVRLENFSCMSEIDYDDITTVTETDGFANAENFLNDKMNDNAQEKEIKKYTLKADVPEFVPRSRICNSVNQTLPLESLDSRTSPTSTILSNSPTCEVHNISLQTIDFCQASLETIEKSVQAEREVTNAETQTIHFMRQENGDTQQNDRKESKMENALETLKNICNKSEQQLKQINELQNQLHIQKDKWHQAEQNKLLAEKMANINEIKLQTRLKELQERVLELKRGKGELRNQTVLLQSLITKHYTQGYEYQKNQISVSEKRCKRMVSDLQAVLKHLSPTTTPTFEECHEQISHWQQELEYIKTQAMAYTARCQEVFDDLHSGIFRSFPEPIDLFSERVELKDILHDNFITVVNNLIKNQQGYQQQSQQQYTAWYHNYGKFRQPGYPPAATLNMYPPYYYNHPQGSLSYPHTVQAMQNRTKNPAIITCPATSSTNLPLPQVEQTASKISEVTLPKVPESCKNTENTDIKSQNSSDDEISNSSSLQTEDDNTGSPKLINSTMLDTQTRLLSSSKTHSDVVTDTFHSAVADEKDDHNNGDDLNNEVEINEPQKSNKNHFQIKKVPPKTHKLQGWWTKNVVKSEPSEQTGAKPVELEKENFPQNERNTPASLSCLPSTSATTESNTEVQSSQEDELANSSQLLKNKLDKFMGGPKFSSLFMYVKNKIHGVTDDELLHAIKAVRDKKSKLSGMSREKIVLAVRVELNGDELTDMSAQNNIKSSKENSDLRCVICVEALQDQTTSTLKCQHTFHIDCIRQWFSSNSVCPVCRLHTVVDEDFPPLNL